MSQAVQLSETDRELLQNLEQELWREATRFDVARMNEILAADFFEFGRSGRVYGREDALSASPTLINARLPLRDFRARLLAPGVAHVTYISVVRNAGVYEFGRRSSIWTRESDGWRLRFHQGTPLPADDEPS